MKVFTQSSLIAFFLLSFQLLQAQFNFKETDKWLKENTPSLGGRATLLIYKDGKVVYSNSENNMSRKQKMIGKFIAKRTGKDKDEVLQDFSENNKIGIASCSKWLSAALVMTFVDDGSLHLSDTVGKYIPTLSSQEKGNITVAQCLSHTTGINAPDLKDSLQSFKNISSMDDAMKMIAAYPMDSKPGESFRYSNVGLQIAAAVIEKIGGKDFRTLFDERIAKPCEMYNTDFGEKPLPLPAGGARSTAADYLHFLQMILEEGNYKGKSILKKETIELMQLNYAKDKKVMHSPAEATSWGYGLGEWTMEDASINKSSNAVTSPGLFGTFPWIDKKNGYAAILFTYNLNNKGRHEKYTELKKIVDEAITKN
jgi:CubicO group peptidase (beta-lactamase class C family)